MSEQDFVGSISTDEIWRGNNTTRCLTDDLNAMDASIDSLESSVNGIGASYAPLNHAHSEYVNTATVNQLINNAVSSTAINNGDDLNNFTDEGVYYRAYSKSSTNTVSNCPDSMYTSTFVLEVFKAGAGGQLVQRATRCHKTAQVVAERVYYSNAWGAWSTVSMNGQKVLWEDVKYMTSGHTATLNDLVSNQVNGITLVFSTYTDGAANNSGFNFKFIPKYFVSAHSGCGVACFLSNVDATLVGHKYLYVHDDKIVGHDLNNYVGDRSGITMNSNRFVLRYVLGC